MTDATVDALMAVRDACTAEGIVASDRRWKKSLRVARPTRFSPARARRRPRISSSSTTRSGVSQGAPKAARLVGELADPVSAKTAEILDAARETAAKVAGLRSSDRKAYIASAAQALDDFKAQQARLAELGRGAGPRAKATLADAGQEIAQLHSDLARSVTHGLGLGGAR